MSRIVSLVPKYLIFPLQLEILPEDLSLVKDKTLELSELVFLIMRASIVSWGHTR